VPAAQTNSINNLQHSPVATNNLGLDNSNINKNGGSPNQVVTLASELAKCQLRRVNLSRSDSDKESECNNNNISNAKTTRAASLACVPDNLMNDLSRKIASRRERIDQQGDGQSMPLNSGSGNSVMNTNGTGIDRAQEIRITEVVSKELDRLYVKFKIDLLDSIKAELRQL